MGTYKNFIETVYSLLSEAKNNNIIHLDTKKGRINNNIINLGNGDAINFGSCSYLGLEFHEKVKKGSINAIKNYGTQFSSSRAYLSIGLYKEYEELLEKIFDASIVITPTTTLGHIAAIPTLINDDDAVILDHQVHSSVQNASNLLKYRNIHIETLKHNDMDMLEDRLKILLSKHNEVWYLADGIYSMYGDGLPAERLEELLNKYKNFRLYVDDAHGMSWIGKNGKGYTLNKMNLHNQMVLAISLAKGYGSGGGVLVFPRKNDAKTIRTCGGPMVTSGPLQPANLGAGIAAAKIHLSSEIVTLQEELLDNIRFTNLMLEKSNLPVVFNSETPIFFIGTSLPKIAFKIIERMKNEGFYTNLGIFPAVPIKNTGVRFTITRLHTFSQIESMINSLEKHYFNVLKEEEFDINRIYEAFNIKNKQQIANNKIIENLEGNFNLKLEHFKTIKDIKQKEWDNLFNNRGSFDWNALNVLENSFAKNNEEENNWDFDYITIKDRNNKIVLATFFTTAINKDDMLAPSEVSFEIEQERIQNPYYLTSRTLFMGSLFSEGEHLYINKNSNYWTNAITILFEKVNEIKTKNKAQNIVFRDFTINDKELDSIFINNGYYKTKMANSFEISNSNWKNENEFLTSLSSNSRKQIKKHILKHSSLFKTNITTYCNDIKKIKKWYNLYLNVKKKSLDLNTFTLPFKLFVEMSKNKKWEKIELLLDNDVTAIVFVYINGNTYNPMLIGIDYDKTPNVSSYRQAIYQLILRANKLNMIKIRLGFSADIEKKRFGAKQIETYTYISTESTYNETIIGNTNTSVKRKLTTT